MSDDKYSVERFYSEINDNQYFPKLKMLHTFHRICRNKIEIDSFNLTSFQSVHNPRDFLQKIHAFYH